MASSSPPSPYNQFFTNNLGDVWTAGGLCNAWGAFLVATGLAKLANALNPQSLMCLALGIGNLLWCYTLGTKEAFYNEKGDVSVMPFVGLAGIEGIVLLLAGLSGGGDDKSKVQ